VPGQSQTGRLIAVEVRIVPEKQQALQSLGFKQDLVRHPLAFASQILDQPVHSPDDTSVNHLVLASGVHVLSHHHSEGFELTCRIPLPAPCECFLESGVPVDHQCCQPIFIRARHPVLLPNSKRTPVNVVPCSERLRLIER